MANSVTITGIKAGSTTITASYGGKTATASITVSAIAPSLTFTALSGTITYDGSRKKIGTVSYNGDGTAYYYIQKATSQPSTPAASADGWVSVSNGGDVYATGSGVASTVGTYYVFLKATGASGGNYTGVNPKQGGNKAISIRTVNVTTTPTYVSTTLTYNGSNNSNGTAQTLINAGTCSAGGTMYYYVSTSHSAPSWNGSTGWTTSLSTGTNAGNYYVWYYCHISDTTNNTAGTNVGSVKELSNGPKNIARAKTATASAKSSLVYNGTTESNGTAQTGVSGSHVTWTGNTSGTNAGSYTAYATPESNFAWSDGTYAAQTVSWSIARRGQTAPVLNGDSKPYHQTASATVKTAGTVSGDTATAPGTLTWTNQTRTAVGEQTATAYYAATTTNFSASPTSTEVTVKITKATDASVTVTLTSGTLTYNGSAQTLATATAHGCTYYLIVHNSSSTAPADNASGWTNNSVSATAAGTYYIWYKGVADSNHSANVAITYKGAVTINRSKTASASAITGLVYNGTTETNGTAQTGVSGSNVSWGGNTTGTNAGSYSATATPTSNYAWSDGSITAKTISWSIARRGQTAPTLTGQTVNYHSTANVTVSTAGKVANGTATAPGTLTYKYDAAGGTNYTTSTTAPSRSAVGTTKVTAYYAATTTNFSASSDATVVSLIVNKASDASVTVTLTSSTLTYNGSNNSNGTVQTLATATAHGCTYYLIVHTSSTTAPAADAAGWTNGSVSATNAGTYYIWYKGTADSNHDNNVAITYKGSVTINRAKTATASAVTGLVYNGTTETNGTAQTGVSGSHVSWSGSTTGTNAGDYSASATPESNFAWSDGTYAAKSISWSIARRGQTAPVLNGASTTYPTTATASVKTAGTVSGGTAAAPGTLVWTNQSRSAYGSQQASAHYAATTTNFSASPESDTVTVSVSQRTVTITAPVFNSNALTYNKTAQTITSGGSCTSGGTMYYYISTSSTKPSFSTSTWTTSTPVQQTNAGTYYMWYYCQVTDTTNNTGDGINTVTAFTGNSKTIGKKEVTLSWSTHTFTYDGTEKTVTCTAGSLVSGDTCTVTVTNNKRTNAGSQTVTAQSLSNNNYKLPSSNTTTLTINKATLTVTEVAFNGTWDGSSHSSYIVIENTDWEGDTVVKGSSTSYGTTVTNSGVPSTPITLMTATGYTASTTIYYKVTGGDNYNDYEDTITFSIAKANATLPGTIKGDSATAGDVAYHNTARATVSRDATGGTVQYSTSANGTSGWSSWANVTWVDSSSTLTTAPAYTTVGQIYVKFRTAGDANHNNSSESSAVTLTVYQAADARMDVDLASGTLTYNGTTCSNGTAQNIATVDTSSTGVGGHYHGIASYKLGYKKGSQATAENQITWVTTTPLQATDAGTYYVYYQFTSNSDHSNNKPWSSHSDNYVGSVTINPKAGSLSASVVNRTYNGTNGNNGTAQTLAGSVSATGTYYFGFGGSASSAPSSWGSANTLPSQTNVGTYYIWAKCNASDNGNCAAVSAKYIGTATISQKTATVTYSVNTPIELFCTTAAEPATTWMRTDYHPEIATSSASGTGTGTISYSISQSGWSISSDGKTITIPSTAAATDTSDTTKKKYTFTVTATQAANGNWAQGSTTKTIELTLKANALENITLTLTANSIAYNSTTTGTVVATYTNDQTKDVTADATYTSNPTGVVTITK